MSDPNGTTKRRQRLLLGGATLGVLALVGAGMLMFDGQPTTRREKPKTVNLTAPGTVEDKDAWRASVGARSKENETLLRETQAKMAQQQADLKALRDEVQDLKTGKRQPVAESVGADASSRPNRLPDEKNVQRVLDAPLPAGERVLNPPNARLPPAGGSRFNTPLPLPEPRRPEALEMITFAGPVVASIPSSGKTRPNTRNSPDKKTSVEFIPAGSSVRVAMLNGVDAPTGGQAQSNPLPIAFQVLDVANLANRYKLDIKDCRFIAAAWGDLSSERTMGRTETLACIIDGETVEMPIKGQVIGEDGKAGIRGRVVTKQGQLLANALLAGTLSGIGRAFQTAATTTTTGAAGITQVIEPDKVAQAGIGGGVSQASTMLAAYYLKAADKLYPVIETDGGRVVEILVTKGAVYEGSKNGRETYRGLLRRSALNSRSNDDE